MKDLQKSRDIVVEKLLELTNRILIGSPSETYRTCGNPNCRCHKGGGKHGPHMYVSYHKNGKSTGYYVPIALHDTVRDGMESWKEFHKLTKQLASLNQEIMFTDHRESKKKKKQSNDKD